MDFDKSREISFVIFLIFITLKVFYAITFFGSIVRTKCVSSPCCELIPAVNGSWFYYSSALLDLPFEELCCDSYSNLRWKFICSQLLLT